MNKWIVPLLLLLALVTPVRAGDLEKDIKPNDRFYGVGWQNDGSHWSVDLIFTGEGAQVAYPSAECTGNWTLLKGRSDRLEYLERITAGKENCIELGAVTLEPLGNGRLLYTFSEHVGKIDAKAVLIREDGKRLSYTDALVATLSTVEMDYLLPEYFSR